MSLIPEVHGQHNNQQQNQIVKFDLAERVAPRPTLFHVVCGQKNTAR
jgi:hypothetical protein